MKLCLNCKQYFQDEIELCPNDRAALEFVGKDPLIGAVINERYLVDSVIGKGCTGIVYKATRLGLGQQVAVKVLHKYRGADSNVLERLMAEAKTASQLRHAHITVLWDSGVTDDGQPYFVMDYPEGTTLAAVLKKNSFLSIARVLPVVKQVCDAFDEAHRLGLVHHEVKSDNILLQETAIVHDYVKVLGFGIAEFPFDFDQLQLAKDKNAADTVAYMSPEQCQAKPVDSRSNIYSLAVVLFEMLTGKRPFASEDMRDVMLMHLTKAAPQLSVIRPDLQFSQVLEQVLAKGLSKDPNQRQQTARELWKELDDACNAGEITKQRKKMKEGQDLWENLSVQDFSVPVTDRLIAPLAALSEAPSAVELKARFGPVPEELENDYIMSAAHHGSGGRASDAVKRLLDSAKQSIRDRSTRHDDLSVSSSMPDLTVLHEPSMPTMEQNVPSLILPENTEPTISATNDVVTSDELVKTPDLIPTPTVESNKPTVSKNRLASLLNFDEEVDLTSSPEPAVTSPTPAPAPIHTLEPVPSPSLGKMNLFAHDDSDVNLSANTSIAIPEANKVELSAPEKNVEIEPAAPVAQEPVVSTSETSAPQPQNTFGSLASLLKFGDASAQKPTQTSQTSSSTSFVRISASENMNSELNKAPSTNESKIVIPGPILSSQIINRSIEHPPADTSPLADAPDQTWAFDDFSNSNLMSDEIVTTGSVSIDQDKAVENVPGMPAAESSDLMPIWMDGLISQPIEGILPKPITLPGSAMPDLLHEETASMPKLPIQESLAELIPNAVQDISTSPTLDSMLSSVQEMLPIPASNTITAAMNNPEPIDGPSLGALLSAGIEDWFDSAIKKSDQERSAHKPIAPAVVPEQVVLPEAASIDKDSSSSDFLNLDVNIEEMSLNSDKTSSAPLPTNLLEVATSTTHIVDQGSLGNTVETPKSFDLERLDMIIDTPKVPEEKTTKTKEVEPQEDLSVKPPVVQTPVLKAQSAPAVETPVDIRASQERAPDAVSRLLEAATRGSGISSSTKIARAEIPQLEPNFSTPELRTSINESPKPSPRRSLLNIDVSAIQNSGALDAINRARDVVSKIRDEEETNNTIRDSRASYTRLPAVNSSSVRIPAFNLEASQNTSGNLAKIDLSASSTRIPLLNSPVAQGLTLAGSNSSLTRIPADPSGSANRLTAKSRAAFRKRFQGPLFDYGPYILPTGIVILVLVAAYFVLSATYKPFIPAARLPLVTRADNAFKDGKLNEAMELYEKRKKNGDLTIAESERLNTIYIMLARQYGKQHRYNEALAMARKAHGSEADKWIKHYQKRVKGQ